jgi:Kef-type K+ transport system membrane component KefB
VESLPLAFSSGWASGVNAYLVVLVLGIADRLGDYAEVPDVLARWDVLAIAGFMYAMEFVADKIPYVDSTWDAVSTLIRPTAGAVIGALLAGSVPEDTSLDTIVLAGVGGTTALLSHLSKAGLRLAINTSPEPVTNIGVSLLEDLAVLALVAFAIQHPRAAAAVAGALLAIGLVLLVLVARLVRRGWRRWKDRRRPAGAVT